MNTKTYISSGLMIALVVLLAIALVSERSGTAIGYPESPTPTPYFVQFNHQVYMPVIMQAPTVSRYINPPINLPATLDPVKFYNMGYYSYTTPTGVVVFDFGQPCSTTSGGITTYGASAFGAGCRSTGEIYGAVTMFIQGYCDKNGCVTYAAIPRLTLALGVSNCTNGGDQCTNPGAGTNITNAHGSAWSQLVSDVASLRC